MVVSPRQTFTDDGLNANTADSPLDRIHESVAQPQVVAARLVTDLMGSAFWQALYR
jgi:hypothetical protein